MTPTKQDSPGQPPGKRAGTRPGAPAWDGMERALDAGTRTVDINRADAAALASLPGVGRRRAELIVAARTAGGPFGSVFDLLRIRGVGRRVFIRMSGLQPAPTKRADRHEALNTLLGLPAGSRPTLKQIAERMAEALGAAGALIADRDGVLLAAGAAIDADAERYAALAPMFFRRTRRYLKRLAGGAVNTVVLPTTHPPLLLATTDAFYAVVSLKSETDLNAAVPLSARIFEELCWLLSPRAVVRAAR